MLLKFLRNGQLIEWLMERHSVSHADEIETLF